ncbi:MAG: hypothetical protein RBU37_13915 [Myxococcota bacterium]|nr:hypothetical protein [Myxococcota bacterium]
MTLSEAFCCFSRLDPNDDRSVRQMKQQAAVLLWQELQRLSRCIEAERREEVLSMTVIALLRCGSRQGEWTDAAVRAYLYKALRSKLRTRIKQEGRARRLEAALTQRALMNGASVCSEDSELDALRRLHQLLLDGNAKILPKNALWVFQSGLQRLGEYWKTAAKGVEEQVPTAAFDEREAARRRQAYQRARNALLRYIDEVRAEGVISDEEHCAFALWISRLCGASFLHEAS